MLDDHPAVQRAHGLEPLAFVPTQERLWERLGRSTVDLDGSPELDRGARPALARRIVARMRPASHRREAGTHGPAIASV